MPALTTANRFTPQNYYLWRWVKDDFISENGVEPDCLSLRIIDKDNKISLWHSNADKDEARVAAVDAHMRKGKWPPCPTYYFRFNFREAEQDINAEGTRITFSQLQNEPSQHVDMQYASYVVNDAVEYLEVRNAILDMATYFERRSNGAVAPV